MADIYSSQPVKTLDSVELQVISKDGSNIKVVEFNASGLKIDLASDSLDGLAIINKSGTLLGIEGSGIAGTAAGKVLTIQGEDGMVPLAIADSNGDTLTAVNGALYSNLRDSSGNELLGQKTKAGSIPVTLASDEDVINVNVVSSVATSSIHDYDTANVTASSSSDHTYTASSDMRISKIKIAASGACKVVVIVTSNGGTTENVKDVLFTTESVLNAESTYDNELFVASGESIILRRYNRESSDMDVYSFINGLVA